MLIRILCCLLLLALAPRLRAADASPAPSGSPETKAPRIEFDSFILVLLVRPPNAPDLPKPELDQLQEGHFANMRRLADEGKLFKAGPTQDFSGRNVRGIFILKTDSVDQAREWVATDPLIKIGRLAPEFMKWSVEKGSLK
ncbi:MAG TPA: YciI family protein [Chthoniobacterales bacterium]|jgi:uncharacterized protein YciI|nr:YciI family protein [Chthoniobacterales bacterium]